MIEYYTQVKSIHVAAVYTSGMLFFMRGMAILAGSQLAMAKPVRFLSYSIDTVLLVTAITLVAILQQYPFVHGWLTVKVLLLAAYIVLGSFALKRARTPSARFACFMAALVVYGFMISVARAHHPLGVLRGLASFG